jgi:hypothetical protein
MRTRIGGVSHRDGLAVLTVSSDDVRMMCRRDDVLACRLQVNSTCDHHTTAAAGCVNMGCFFNHREAVSSEESKTLISLSPMH